MAEMRAGARVTFEVARDSPSATDGAPTLRRGALRADYCPLGTAGQPPSRRPGRAAGLISHRELQGTGGPETLIKSQDSCLAVLQSCRRSSRCLHSAAQRYSGGV
jgi:hypothetical protein